MATDNDTSEHEAHDDARLSADPAWRAALVAETTAATMEHVREYARFLLACGADAYCDETPAELADAALSDTALGRGSWEPERGPLARFLCGRVRKALGLRARAAERMVRLDYIEDGHRDAVVIERALSHTPAPLERLASREGAATAVGILRERCAADPEATAYLAARLAGHERLTEIATVMQVPVAAVRATHRRIVRHARALPAHLHEQVIALLA